MSSFKWATHIKRYLIGKVFSRIVLWVFILLIGYQLQDKESYSHFLTFMLAGQLIAGVINAGMPAAILRFGVINSKQETDKASAQDAWGVSLVVGGSLSAMLFVLGTIIGENILRFPLEMVAITCLYGLLLAQEANYSSIFQLKNRSDLYERYYLILSFLILVIIAVLYYYEWKNKVFQATLFYVLGIIGSLSWATSHVYKLIGLPSIRRWKEPLSYGVPLLPHLAGMYILTSADFFIIKYILGEEVASTYGFAYQATSIISMFTASIVAYITPIYYTALQQKDSITFSTISKRVNLISVALFVISFVGIFILFFIINLYFDRYLGSLDLIYILSPSFVFHFIYAIAGIPLMFYGKTSTYSLISVLIAGYNILANYIIIGSWGAVGVALVNVTSYALLSIITVHLMRTTSEYRISFKRSYILASLSVSLGLILVFLF